MLELVSDDLRVAIRPEKGADIVAIEDLRTGVDVLWRAPWGSHQPGAHPFAESSTDYWIARNGGGWNLLLPNAGPQRDGDGGAWGFHGEAAVVSWEVLEVERDRAVLATALLSAPLTVRREVSLAGDRLVIDETIENESPDVVSFRWGHHPTFGSPFIEDGVELELPDGRLRVATATGWGELDDSAGTTWHDWPVASGQDLSRVVDGRAVLAYITGHSPGRYRIVNRRLDLAVELRWPGAVFPWLWLWAELACTPGYPWFRRVRALALEPHSSVPDGPEGCTLHGLGSVSARLELRVTRAS